MLMMRVTVFAAKIRKSMTLSSTVYSLFSMCSSYFVMSWNLTMIAKFTEKLTMLLTIRTATRVAISSILSHSLLIV